MVSAAAASSGAAASLIARVRPIWPSPTHLRVSRHIGKSDVGSQNYLVLPSLRRPVLLLPSESAAASGAIVRFDEGQRAKPLLRVLAWAQEKGLLYRLPLARLAVSDRTGGPLAVVAHAVPDADTIVVRLGRPRHGRAVILNALDARGRSLAFAKCAWGAGVTSLRQESANLRSMSSQPISGVRTPQVLGMVEQEGFAALVLEALTPQSSAAEPSGVPVEAMMALAERRGWQSSILRLTPVVSRLRVGIEAVQSPDERGWLTKEMDRLVAELGDIDTRTGSWHGDWVPWNMTRDADTILLWDWEHYEDGVLPGFDHLHYLAQELRLRQGTTQRVEDTWLDAAKSALATSWALRDAEANAAVRTYLLAVNLRYVTDREGAPDGTPPRAGWSRQLLERLGDPR